MALRAINAGVALLLLCGTALAHYNLLIPKPYNRIDCNPWDCMGPCPPIWKSGGAKARNSPERPAAVWRRGQDVTIRWERNNHFGGIYRRSLVPVKYMNSHAWHKKLAFEWGCWNQGKFKCGRGPKCGTDFKGFAFQNRMTVPKVFPDGDYVFSMTWFGGLHWTGKKAMFSDYYTCAFVKIRGGRYEASHTPTFKPGRSDRAIVPKGVCATTSLYAGQCKGRPCHRNPVYYSKPGVFRNGRTPPKVLLSMLDSKKIVPDKVKDSELQTGSLEQEKKAMEQNKKEAKLDEKQAKEAASSAKKPVHKRPMKPKPRHPWRRKPQKPVWKPWKPRKPVWKPWWKRNRKPWKLRRRKHVNIYIPRMRCPPGPRGPWGPHNSAMYNRKRHQWWRRHNCCKKYKNRIKRIYWKYHKQMSWRTKWQLQRKLKAARCW